MQPVTAIHNRDWQFKKLIQSNSTHSHAFATPLRSDGFRQSPMSQNIEIQSPQFKNHLFPGRIRIAPYTSVGKTRNLSVSNQSTHQLSMLESNPEIQAEQRLWELTSVPAEQHISSLQKQLRHLSHINNFLQMSCNQKDLVIESQRKEIINLKDKLSIVKSVQKQKGLREAYEKKKTQAHEFAQLIDSQIQNSIGQDNEKANTPEEMTSSQLIVPLGTGLAVPKRNNIQRSSMLFSVSQRKRSTILNQQPNSPRNQNKFYQRRTENKETNEILRTNISDAECMRLWNENENISFLNSLLDEPEQFQNYLAHSGTAQHQLLQEKIKKSLSDCKLFFQMILRLKKIIHAACLMTEQLTISESLENICQQTKQCIECDRATVFVLDQKRNELWSKAATGQKNTIRFALGQGLAGHVALQREKLNITNAYTDTRFNKEFDQKSGYKTQNVLCMPILDGQKCLGVIQCINKFNGYFTKDDEGLLAMISDFAKIVLKNALQFDEQYSAHNKYRHLIITGIYFSKLNTLQDLLEQSQKRLKDLLNVEEARVFIKIDGNKLQYLDLEGKLCTTKNMENAGLAGLCCEQKTQLVAANCSDHASYNPEVDIQSSLPVVCVPIVSSPMFQSTAQSNSQNEDKNAEINTKENKSFRTAAADDPQDEVYGVIQFLNLKYISNLIQDRHAFALHPIDQEALQYSMEQILATIRHIKKGA